MATTDEYKKVDRAVESAFNQQSTYFPGHHLSPIQYAIPTRIHHALVSRRRSCLCPQCGFVSVFPILENPRLNNGISNNLVRDVAASSAGLSVAPSGSAHPHPSDSGSFPPHPSGSGHPHPSGSESAHPHPSGSVHPHPHPHPSGSGSGAPAPSVISSVGANRMRRAVASGSATLSGSGHPHQHPHPSGSRSDHPHPSDSAHPHPSGSGHPHPYHSGSAHPHPSASGSGAPAPA